MSTTIDSVPVVYPESDGKPMADNTVQFDWIQKLAGNLQILFHDRRDEVFVGGNLFWYPVQGSPRIVQAPDSFVVIGRPQGFRRSYQQWNENNVPMTVVFEIRSPNDSERVMQRKYGFYQRYGVREYFMYDPENNLLEVYLRQGTRLVETALQGGRLTSPTLGIHFQLTLTDLLVFYPDGSPFRTTAELDQLRREAEQQRRDAEQRANNAEQQRREAERRLARQTELSRKILRGEATTDELAELQRLVNEPLP